MKRKDDWLLWLGIAGLLGLAGGVGTVEVIELNDLEKRVRLLADGIELAEGAGVAGSRPARNNNPGDLRLDTIGKSTGVDDAGFQVYATYEDGREALEKQVRLMLTNTSHIYNENMTVLQVAVRYTTTDQEAWAWNVASAAGVTPDTPINQIPV